MNKATRHLKNVTVGFTLIEVLLAVAIFGVVIASINAVFYSAMRLYGSSTKNLDVAVPVQQAFSTIRRDLQGALPPGGFFAANFRSVASQNTMNQGAAAGVEFSTSTGLIGDNATWGDIQRIGYELRDRPDRPVGSGRSLVRRVTRNLLPTAAEEPEEQWILNGIERVEFTFSSGGSAWKDSWDTAQGDSRLPKTVKIHLQTRDPQSEGRVLRDWEMTVALNAESITNQATSTGGSR
jgi:type II secretion system protein J